MHVPHHLGWATLFADPVLPLRFASMVPTFEVDAVAELAVPPLQKSGLIPLPDSLHAP
jgi:hypothetical protein